MVTPPFWNFSREYYHIRTDASIYSSKHLSNKFVMNSSYNYSINYIFDSTIDLQWRTNVNWSRSGSSTSMDTWMNEWRAQAIGVHTTKEIATSVLRKVETNFFFEESWDLYRSWTHQDVPGEAGKVAALANRRSLKNITPSCGVEEVPYTRKATSWNVKTTEWLLF